jgi:hypothetical protein
MLDPKKWDRHMAELQIVTGSVWGADRDQTPTLLVPCEHPYLHVCFLESLDSIWNTILEFVLNGCGSQ